MKSYVITIEQNDKPDADILMLIIKALARDGIEVKSAGMQKMKPINLQKIPNIS